MKHIVCHCSVLHGAPCKIVFSVSSQFHSQWIFISMLLNQEHWLMLGCTSWHTGHHTMRTPFQRRPVMQILTLSLVPVVPTSDRHSACQAKSEDCFQYCTYSIPADSCPALLEHSVLFLLLHCKRQNGSKCHVTGIWNVSWEVLVQCQKHGWKCYNLQKKYWKHILVN